MMLLNNSLNNNNGLINDAYRRLWPGLALNASCPFPQ